MSGNRSEESTTLKRPCSGPLGGLVIIILSLGGARNKQATRGNTCTAVSLLSCCLTSTEVRWPVRDGDRVGRGRESERLDSGNRPKKTGETVDRRHNNGSVKAVSPRHCPATCALSNCCFNCCAGQSQ